MKIRSIFIVAAMTIATVSATSTLAFAYCGVIQESGTAKFVDRASQKARAAAMQKIRKLRRENGAKLQADEVNLACVGGAVAIDANGKQIEGKPSCTATVSFCVNP